MQTKTFILDAIKHFTEKKNIYIYTIDIVFLYFIIVNLVFGSENNGGASTNWNYRSNWSLLLTTAFNTCRLAFYTFTKGVFFSFLPALLINHFNAS